jgi:metal-sulfur cluster biosynthetic enzyme
MTEDTKAQVAWQIENTHPDLVEPLKDGFRQIIDPEIGLNIIELGLVRDVILNQDSAQVTMILTTPFCPYGPAIMETTRAKAEEHLNLPTTIEMGTEMWDLSYMEEGAGAEWGLF